MKIAVNFFAITTLLTVAFVIILPLAPSTISECESTWISDKYRTLENEMYLVAEYQDEFRDFKVDTDAYQRNDIYGHVVICKYVNDLTGITIKTRIWHVEPTPSLD